LTTTNKDFKVKHGLSVSGGAIFGQAIEIGTPTANNHAATKEYTDEQVEYAAFPDAVTVATTENVSLSSLVPGATVDGVPLLALTRVLVKDQTTASQNGIYEVQSSGPATRAPDYNNIENMRPGKLVGVLSGDVNAQTFWSFFNSNLNLGTDPIVYVNLSESIGGNDYLAGFGINILENNFIEIDSSSVILSQAGSSGTAIDNTVLNSNLESLGNLTSLNVLGAADFDGTVTFDDSVTVNDGLSVNGSLSVIGQSNTLSVQGPANFSGAVTVPEPTQAANPATKDYVDNLLNQESVEITTIDDLSNYFNGFESRFYPTYQGIPVTLRNPFNLLLSIDGIIQSVGYPDYVWQSVMPRVGFRIDNDGYIAFPEPIPPGSGFDARVLVGSSTTQQTKIYPFKAMDIVLGGY
jgi:hypothetical protein